MRACDDCAWPMSCHVAGQCARAPFTAAQEARIRELFAEEIRFIAPTPEQIQEMAKRIVAARLSSDDDALQTPSGVGDV